MSLPEPTAAGDELERRQRIARTIAENATASLFMTDAEGRCTYMNPAAERSTGYVFDEVRGRRLHEVIHHTRPDGTPFPRGECLLDSSLSEMHSLRDLRDTFVRKDGSFFPVICTASPILEEDRRVGTVIEIRDITEEHRLTQQLESERTRLRDIFERTPGLIATLRGPNHVFESANPTYVQFVGGRDIIGRTIGEALPETIEQGFVDLLDRVYRGGEPYVGREVSLVLDIDGCREEHFVDFVYQPLADHDGRITGIFVHGTDVTEQVHARRVVERQAEELEQTNLALLRAQEALRRADRRKDEFLATLSHELRTPLTAILGWARMLNIGDLDEELMRTATQTIEQSAQVQAQLIDDVLDLSRIISGKIRIESSVVNVARIVTSALEGVRLAAAARHIHLDVDVGSEPEELMILGDGNRIQQVIWNLLTNAIKFTPEGGTVRLTAGRPDGSVVISVRDSGIGISPDFLPHVFEPFRQAEDPTTRSHGGLGLGLSIVRHLVELHGGSIRAASEGEGKGATFTVTLPLLRQMPLPSPRASATSVANTESDVDFADLTGRSVLVIDDQASVRDFFVAVLQRCGADVRAAASVRVAIQAIEEAAPDVVVCDIAMPDEDGFAFIEWLRAQPAHADTRVIAVTAFGRPEDQQRILDAGFDAYLRKPIEPAELSRSVGAAVGPAVGPAAATA
jgi:PAS domain S-box-containing protein